MRCRRGSLDRAKISRTGSRWPLIILPTRCQLQDGFGTANRSGKETIEKLLNALAEAADSARDRMAQGVAEAGSTDRRCCGKRGQGYSRGD